MTTRRNRPPSKQARRPEGARPHKPSRPHKGRPETREARTDERGRTDERKPSGRKFSERSPSKFSERKVSEGKFSGRKFSDRNPAEPRATEHKRVQRKPSDRRNPSDSREHATSERKPWDGKPWERPSRDQKADDRKRADRGPKERGLNERGPKDRKFTDRKPAVSKSADRKPADRRPENRKPFESKPFGRKPSEHRFSEPRQSERNIDKPDVAVETPPAQLSAAVQTVEVTPDENGMRVDRFLEARFAGLSFSHIQRIIRKGQLRVDSKRVEPKDRLEAGQSVRIPPLRLDPEKPRPEGSKDEETRAFLTSITLYDDDDVMVLNKPAGLAVQGGSGTTRHLDGMLGVIRTKDGQRPRLVHRLDKETAGCLLIAKSRFAAAALGKTFRSRSARKIYWALVPGVPKPKQGRISTFLAKEEREDDSVMRVAQHGDEGASHAITYYAVVETAAARLAWLSLKPVTGRTHQLRVQLAHIGHPIVGDPKYFNIENWELPGGIQNRLHLLARRIAVPHPRGGVIDVSAPLPQHMQQSWNLIGLDATRYDPIEDAPEE